MVQEEKMESLVELFTRTINEGSPLYNKGKVRECFDLYMDATKHACAQEKLAKSIVGRQLDQAADEAMKLAKRKHYKEGAWVLRYAFDQTLGEQDRISNATNFEEESLGYWQDEKVPSQNNNEMGQCLADMGYILRDSIKPKQHNHLDMEYSDCFLASEAVEVLVSVGLAGNRQMASEKLSSLLMAGIIMPVSHEDKKKFIDGTSLYRFPSTKELRDSLAMLEASGGNMELSDKNILTIAVKITLNLPIAVEDNKTEKKISKILSRQLQPNRRSTLSPEKTLAYDLAQLTTAVESAVQIQDRKWGLLKRTYANCFVGSEAVSVMVQNDLASTRQEAKAQLNKILEIGLIYHVTRDHLFEDKELFYRFTSLKDIKEALDALSALPVEAGSQDMFRLHVLEERFNQTAKLDINCILNSFYGCESKNGWDLVDLQNWRNNMKRWGFGRPEDQDDDMVEKLAPLVLNIDPTQWDKTGDEEWESPWGILAQIALFDQIPRSAFRGKPEAFKWDELAIRATKVGIKKGYFENAFKSTLNQFVVLLPLEHSESWEDQKLGVGLLLQMLSTVAIQDKGLSDYDIVKRLEFSKRLTTAFLEHAQVIAKFKRYPHRNRQHGRTTSLEERVWLASDLVPRWAKSQNEEASGEGKNIITLPVIPLKRLTRGR